MRVSRSGRFELYCGQFTTSGVSGTCGATSRRVTSNGRAYLKLAPVAFVAEANRRVRMRFKLTPYALGRLKAAKKLRMTGRIVATGPLGGKTLQRDVPLHAEGAEAGVAGAASAPSWIRTSGLPLRRGTLCPAELSGLALPVQDTGAAHLRDMYVMSHEAVKRLTVPRTSSDAKAIWLSHSHGMT